jgi:hypothetical protein
MADRLSIYSMACLMAGERALASLSENREPRYLLDQVWNDRGVDKCLEEGQWRFAFRTVQIDYDPGVTPTFGYAYAFDKPVDYVITTAVCQEDHFRVPLLQYSDEGPFWYADIQTIYVKYVSNDANYGGNLGKWPPAFEEFVAAHFASRIVLKLSNDEKKTELVMKLRENLLKKAKSKSAMADPTSFEAQGAWSRSRMRWRNRSDGGNTTGSLIG